MSESRLVTRNVISTTGRTSIRLEPELWDALDEMCRRERRTLTEAVQQVERHGWKGGRTSALRCGVLTYFRSAATEEGHRLAGHGGDL